MEALKLLQNVYERIMKTIGFCEPEVGGILGSTAVGIITDYYFDSTGTSEHSRYVPDTQTINCILKNEWKPQGILMVGIVHSHANGVSVPSCGDISYGIRILKALDTVNRFYLPIVSFDEGSPKLTCYCILPDDEREYVCEQIPWEICSA